MSRVDDYVERAKGNSFVSVKRLRQMLDIPKGYSHYVGYRLRTHPRVEKWSNLNYLIKEEQDVERG